MSDEGKLLFELLPVEINAPHLKQVFRSQLKKGITLSDVLPAVEKSLLQKIRRSVSALSLELNPSKIESQYIQIKRAVNEVLKWLEFLVEVRKEGLSVPLEGESKAVHKIAMELQELLKALDPALKSTLKKREEENKDIRSILNDSIDHMEKETFVRTKKIVLKYEKMGKEKYGLVQSVFDQFFSHLRSHSDKILDFIQPRLSEWNQRVLGSGRGFLINSIPDLPCSVLFSIKGECRLIFENVGHLLGSGVDKLVFRSICLPSGKIQALIKPIIYDDTPDMQRQKKELQFHSMWLETEMLMKFKGKKGIVVLDERMAFEIEGEKKLFLAEDYYWDGTLWDCLKYPIQHKIESAKLPPNKQRKIIFDLLSGLSEIHKNHIIHHDIKPDNILLDLKRTSAVIADFHLALSADDVERIKSSGFIARWAPPEYAKIQLNTDRPFDEILRDKISITSGKLDIWGMGLIFYALIAYELPFWVKQDDSPPDEEEMFLAIAGLKKGWLPHHLKTSSYFPLLEKMLEPEQKDRCTALEALEILKRCLA